MLSKVRNLRVKYFPNKLKVGNCIDICILIGVLLQEQKYAISLCHGTVDRCFHTWLVVNGIHIDPSTDCITNSVESEFVIFVNNKYKILDIENFDLSNYYSGLSIQEIYHF